ncbi:MAG: NADH-quinone oxidoreductase subunit C [Methanospirillum sp.]|nr:NADH-quinone oxidoreductase subunit C [Methanospirillum sp.]
MIEPLTLDGVANAVAGVAGAVDKASTNRIRVRTTREGLRDVIRRVQWLLPCDRLVSISTVDTTESIELHYHLIGQHRTVVTVTVELPRDAPEIETVSDLLPSAALYERQIHDLFGVVFRGHPGLTRLILNDDWPRDEHPLRKDWKPVAGTFYGGAGRRGPG